MQRMWSLAAVAASALIVGCATTGDAEPEAPVRGVALLFVENEPGFETNFLSYLVTPDFLRIDDKSQGDNFILFNRRKREIYNVINSEKTISVITAQDVKIEPPLPIDYTYEKQESGAVTRGDASAKGYYYKFSANGTPCYNVVVAEGYLPDVAAAFREFRAVLAGEHATTVGRIPADQIDACDLALNVFYATRHLEFGFPVREWDAKGYSKFLRDVQLNVEPEENVLELPEGYKRERLGQNAPALKME